MDAATAALWASSITGAVALGGALLAPHLTAKRARETELLKMRRDAYVAAIQHVDKLNADDSPEGIRNVAMGMMIPSTQLKLLGNDDIAALYTDLYDELISAADKEEQGEDASDAYERGAAALVLFIEAARAHLGVDDLDR